MLTRGCLAALLLSLLLVSPAAAVPPVNDRCEGAIFIPCGNINLSGATHEATNDYFFTDSVFSCTGYRADGKDVVYKLSVGPGDSLWVDYHTISDGSIYLVTDCSNIQGSCVIGKDDFTLPGATERLRVKFSTGGTYYLILDSYAPNSSGDWNLVGQLVCGASTPPSNDLCESAVTLPCGTFNLSGNTQFAHNNYILGGPSGNSCTGNPAEGRDVVYKVNAKTGDSIWVNYTSSSNASIYIVGNCSDPTLTCVWGEDQNIETQVETLRYRFDFTGTYYIILDSRGSETWGSWNAYGAFICVTPPPPNDRCADAINIPCGNINISGTMELAVNDYSLIAQQTCTGYATEGPDVVYRINAFAHDLLNVTYTLLDGDGSIYIVSSCSNPDSACLIGRDIAISDEPETLSYVFPTSGTYYLIADAADAGTAGTFTLTGNRNCGLNAVGDVVNPATLELRSVAPNPFHRSTGIDYSMPIRSRATLRIYDLQGRVTRTLIDGDIEPGAHRVTWDGRDDQGARVSAGVYFARLTSGGKMALRRMIFVQ